MGELNGAPAGRDQLERLGLVGYGHFTTMRVDGGRVRGLSLHLERLVRDCRQVFDADLDPERVRRLVRHALAGHAGGAVVRVTVFDPALDLAHAGADAEPHVLVTLRPAGSGRPAALRLAPAGYVRESAGVKHVGLFGAVRHRRAAQRRGFDDALFVDPTGAVCEASTSNVGFVDGDRIVWPDGEHLPGVTRRLIDRFLDDRAVTRPVTLAELPAMRAAFATNAVVGVRPVAAVDDVCWPGDHPAVASLRAGYERIPPEPL